MYLIVYIIRKTFCFTFFIAYLKNLNKKCIFQKLNFCFDKKSVLDKYELNYFNIFFTLKS